MLRRGLQWCITLTPRTNGARGYDFTAPVRFDNLLAGVVVTLQAWLVALLPMEAGRGTEDIGT